MRDEHLTQRVGRMVLDELARGASDAEAKRRVVERLGPERRDPAHPLERLWFEEGAGLYLVDSLYRQMLRDNPRQDAERVELHAGAPVPVAPRTAPPPLPDNWAPARGRWAEHTAALDPLDALVCVPYGRGTRRYGDLTDEDWEAFARFRRAQGATMIRQARAADRLRAKLRPGETTAEAARRGALDDADLAFLRERAGIREAVA